MPFGINIPKRSDETEKETRARETLLMNPEYQKLIVTTYHELMHGYNMVDDEMLTILYKDVQKISRRISRKHEALERTDQQMILINTMKAMVLRLIDEWAFRQNASFIEGSKGEMR
jgi:hypothetical protein